MILISLHTEIDQISGMGDDGSEPIPQRMMGKSEHLGLRQRLGKPLHIILHKNLDRRAADPNTTLNSRGDPADCRDMRTEEREQIITGFFLRAHHFIKIRRAPGGKAAENYARNRFAIGSRTANPVRCRSPAKTSLPM